MCERPVISIQALFEAGENLNPAQVDRIKFRSGIFDNAILINIPGEERRLRDSLHTLDKVDIYAEKFKAFSGDDLKNGKYFDEKFFSRYSSMKNGELGCLFSHLCALYVASTHPDQDLYTIIFEDDIVTSASKESFNKTLESIKDVTNEETIHLIYFGKCMESCTQMGRIIDNLYRAVSPSCTHSYAIKNSFAAKIISDFEECCLHPNSAINCDFFEKPIDKIYADYLSFGIARGIVVHPGIFYQDVLRKPSLIKGNHLSSYQECGDLDSVLVPVEQSVPNQEKRSYSSINYIVIICIIIIVLILILQLARKRKRTSKAVAAVLAFAIFGLFLIVYRRRNNMTKQGLTRLTLNTILQYSQRGRRNFPMNSSIVPSRKHDFFNPNGIVWANASGDPIFLTSTRSFDGVSSYPLLQIYDPYLNGRHNYQLLYSKILWLSSDRSMKSRHSLGYEDMRIFSYRGEIYLIGVNLDRSETSTPSMILVKLDQAYNHVKTWHLVYKPTSKWPNKNWAPIILNDGELGFVVDLDPILIVKRIYKDHKYQEECELVYKGTEKVATPTIRNSTITISWDDVPLSFREVFNNLAPIKSNYRRFVMMGHSKYISVNILRSEVLYQHYFVIIDLPPNLMDMVEVHFSGPLHVEERYSPHIEYISGVCFLQTSPGNDDSWIINIMYGLRDLESSYITLNPNELERLFKENQIEEMPEIPKNH